MGVGVGVGFDGHPGEAPGSGEFDGTSGWTDFSEFEDNADPALLPAGMTLVHTGGAEFAISMGTDEAEGDYLELAGVDGGRMGAGLDFLGSSIQHGEVLARFQIPVEAANVQIQAFMGAVGATLAGSLHRGGFRISGVTETVDCLRYNNGGTQIGSTNKSIVGANWFWVRFRSNDAGGGDIRFRVTMWNGTLANEPAMPDIDVTTATTVTTGRAGVVILNGNTVTTILRCSYFAFSNDPDTVPPPVPA